MNKKLIINIYNQEIKKESIQYEDKIKYKALLVKEGKAKAYNEDEFLDLLEKEGLQIKKQELYEIRIAPIFLNNEYASISIDYFL